MIDDHIDDAVEERQAWITDDLNCDANVIEILLNPHLNLIKPSIWTLNSDHIDDPSACNDATNASSLQSGNLWKNDRHGQQTISTYINDLSTCTQPKQAFITDDILNPKAGSA